MWGIVGPGDGRMHVGDVGMPGHKRNCDWRCGAGDWGRVGVRSSMQIDGKLAKQFFMVKQQMLFLKKAA